MERIALLIGSPGLSEGYLPGVEVDVKNFEGFLLSPFGGQWYEKEIIL